MDCRAETTSARSTLTINQVRDLTGGERQKTWQEVFRMVHEDLIPDMMMFHMVGYTPVGPRVDFTPDISTNSELQVANVKFK